MELHKTMSLEGVDMVAPKVGTNLFPTKKWTRIVNEHSS